MAQNEIIELLVLDVDGVLTDGRIYIDDDARQCKSFHIRDGLGIAMWRAVGKQAAILTSKNSPIVDARADMLGIELIEKGAEDKAPGLERILSAAGVAPDRVAYMGDDLLDAVAMRKVGYPITVADGADEIKALARLVTVRPGGHGAVREAIEHLLKRENRWADALEAIGANR